MSKAIFCSVAVAVAVATAGCGSSTSTTAGAAAPGVSGGRYAPAAATGSSAQGATVLTSKQDKLGTVLAAGPKHLTVYLFEADSGSQPTCTGTCATVWPPVTSSSAPSASDGALAGDLATVALADGKRQVTYKGHPLYYYARDEDSGDAYGQGVNSFGAGWYAISPAGAKIDSADSTGGTSTGAAAPYKY